MRPLVLYGQMERAVEAQTELATATEMYREMGMMLWLVQAEAMLAENSVERSIR